MKVHTYEKGFLAVGGVLLVACLFALLYASVAHGIRLPGRVATIDPARVYQTPPFDKPGLRQVGPREYVAVMVGQAWAFNPAEIRVPRGSTVTFRATSIDVLHGMNVEGTRVNLMLIPGQIGESTQRFDEPGEFLIICHEYCGIGHHTMAGKVIVE